MPNRIGKIVQLKREELGLSKSDLARMVPEVSDELSSISPSTISRIERGQVKRSHPRTLRALETALKLKEGDLTKFVRNQDGEDSRGKEAKMLYLDTCREEITGQLRKFGHSLDTETRIRKNYVGCSSVQNDPYWTGLWEYITDCWSLKTEFRDRPLLTRHYIKIFHCTMNPEMSIQEIEAQGKGTEEEAWKYIIHSFPEQANDDAVKKLETGAQIILARLFREVGTMLGDRLMVDGEWMFAKRAFEIYLRCEADDKEEQLLFDLAIATICAAAYSLNLEGLDELDRNKVMVRVIKAQADTDKNRGALHTAGVYHASRGEMDIALSYFQQLERYYDAMPAVERQYIGNLIMLWCCEVEMGLKPHTVFQELFKIPGWFAKAKSNPLLFAIGLVAMAHPGLKWRAIMEKIKQQGPDIAR